MQPRGAPRPFPGIPLDAVILGILFLALAVLGWRRWPDLLVDFGQQLYIPWRLSEGERLHRDILFLHGPLSQHLNAFLFRMFGVSLKVLLLANLAILAALGAALHRIVRLASDRVTAFLCTLLFLALFAMSQYVMVGNYNFVSPYTHEAAHGTGLAIAMLLFLGRWLATGLRRDAALAGLALGLALATKIDVSLAAGATALAAILLARPWRFAGDRRTEGNPRTEGAARTNGRRREGVSFLFAGAALPCAAFLVYFLTYLPAGEAVRAATAGFASLPDDPAGNRFYRGVLGVDWIETNLLLMLKMTCWLVAFVAAAAGADVLAGRMARRSAPWAVGSGLALFLTLVIWPGLVPWVELPRALPVAAAILSAVSLVLARRDTDRAWERPSAGDPAALFLLSLFGLALLAKIALNVHLFHYGFYLAMPAAVALAAACLHWAPRVLRANGSPGTVFRALSIAVVLAAVLFHLRWSRTLYSLKDLPVGRGADVVLTYGPSVQTSGAVSAEALRWIEERTPAGATVVALPEGIMLNYQARRRTTVPFVNFTMGEMLRFGEERLLGSLERIPPDYVALVHKKTEEFGVGRFGVDERYGRRVIDWIEARYAPVVAFGGDPLRDEEFGIRILERKQEDR